MDSHWDGHVHYYDFTPATVTRVEGSDARRVGLAFVYDPAARTSTPICIDMWVTPQELLGDIDLAKAIETARTRIVDLVRHHEAEAKGNKRPKAYVYSWKGQVLMEQ